LELGAINARLAHGSVSKRALVALAHLFSNVWVVTDDLGCWLRRDGKGKVARGR
jgi:hypothetical protein